MDINNFHLHAAFPLQCYNTPSSIGISIDHEYAKATKHFNRLTIEYRQLSSHLLLSSLFDYVITFMLLQNRFTYVYCEMQQRNCGVVL